MTITGRTYKKGRPKGAAPWKPRADSLDLLDKVRDVLASYAFPITARQVFYRLVGTHGYPKDEKAVNRVGYLLGRARRAGMIGWDEIADDSLSRYGPIVHPDGIRDFFAWAHDQAKDHFFGDWTDGQTKVPIVWTESEGMAASLRAGLAGLHWPVEVVSTSGSDSVKPKYEMARDAIDLFDKTGQVTVIGHVGDLDEAGLSILDALDADLTQFCIDAGAAGAILVEWVALTPTQVIDFTLATAPGKKPTSRSAPGGTMADTAQCEALDPNDLLNIVDYWLRSHVNLAVLNDHLEVSARRKIRARTWLWELRNGIVADEDGIGNDDPEP